MPETYLVNVAKNGFLYAVVLDNLAKNATITTTDNQYLLRVGVGVHSEMSYHLLVSESR